MLRLAMAVGLAALVVGCGGPDLRPGPVKTTGVVRTGGRPLKDVNLNLQPTEGGGLPGTFAVGADGRVTVELVPGKYVFYVTAIDGKAAAIRGVPEAYQSPQADHTVEIREGKEFEVTVG